MKADWEGKSYRRRIGEIASGGWKQRGKERIDVESAFCCECTRLRVVLDFPVSEFRFGPA